MFYDGVNTTYLENRARVLKHLHGRMIFGPFENIFLLWFSLERTHSSNILYSYKTIFVNFFCHEDWFYNQYINSTIRTKYLDENVTGVKPKQFFSK